MKLEVLEGKVRQFSHKGIIHHLLVLGYACWKSLLEILELQGSFAPNSNGLELDL